MAALENISCAATISLSLLFTPPFDHAARDPGYIKGYPPGIRENGGQYTHGAVWAALAFAMQATATGRASCCRCSTRSTMPTAHTGSSSLQGRALCRLRRLYSEPPHVGRGGWTWYTGSAGWMYRVALEWTSRLSVARRRLLALDPCIPQAGPASRSPSAIARARYEIAVENPLQRLSRGPLGQRSTARMLTAKAKAYPPGGRRRHAPGAVVLGSVMRLICRNDKSARRQAGPAIAAGQYPAAGDGLFLRSCPTPRSPRSASSFGTSGHRGSAFATAFNEAHILAIAQAVCLYRRHAGIDGPLFLGMDTHALSEAAFASALSRCSRPMAWRR